MSSSHHQHNPESKKEDFRKYLVQSGVIDSLTKVLVGLYEEPDRPQDAVEYIKKFMGIVPSVSTAGGDANLPDAKAVEAIKTENEELKAKVKHLEQTVEELQKILHKQASSRRGGLE